MNSINILKNFIVDRNKVRELVGQKSIEELEELLKVRRSQAYYVKRGDRMPTIDGLMRIMMLHGLAPEDLVTLAPQK